MKEKFDNFYQQMSYVNKFVERNTNLKKECMICGKPATIQHNKAFPYMIRILCKSCRTELGLNCKTVDNVIIDLPIINAKEHIIRPSKLYRDRVLTEKDMNIIDEAIKNKYNKNEVIKKYNLNKPLLKNMLTLYEAVRPGITEEFNKSAKIGQRRVMLNAAVQRSNKNSKVNFKINQLKLEKNLSNQGIVDKCNNKISKVQLALIIEGKVEANNIHKELIAKALDVSVEDIF